MKTSQQGINDLVLSEGLRISAYKDPKGIWTIGVGHTSMAGPPEVHPGLTVTRKEALDIFARDLARFEKRVSKKMGEVPQHVFDGAVSFDFNTGSIDKATWVNLYNLGKHAQARDHFMYWNKPAEIISRRKREAALIFDGKYATTPLTTPLIPTAITAPPGPVAVPAEAVSPSTSAGDLIADFITWLFGLNKGK